MQSQCVRIPLKPEHADEFVRFVRELATSPTELAEVMLEEEMSAELVFIDAQPDETAVLIYTRAPDLARANEIFMHSKHPVQARMRELSARAFDLDRARLLEVGLTYP